MLKQILGLLLHTLRLESVKSKLTPKSSFREQNQIVQLQTRAAVSPVGNSTVHVGDY